MITKRDEVYGLSPMDKLALETSRPSISNDPRKYKDSILTSDDLIVEGQQPPPRRKKRSPHCWLFTALFLFVIIMSTLLLVHFHDEITGHAGVPVNLENPSKEDESQRTFYMNVESGLMGNKKMSGVEAGMLNALASRDTVKIEQYLKNLNIRPRNTTKALHVHSTRDDADIFKSFDIFDTSIFTNDDGTPIDVLALILKYMPYLVQFLGGPSAGIPVAMLWVVNTVEMKPLLEKYLGQEFVDTLVKELEGEILPGSQTTTPSPDASATSEKSPGFLALGSPDLIFPSDEYLISPETAAELQGLLYS